MRTIEDVLTDAEKWRSAFPRTAPAYSTLGDLIGAIRETVRYLDDPAERLMGHHSPAVYVEPLRHAIANALRAEP